MMFRVKTEAVERTGSLFKVAVVRCTKQNGWLNRTMGDCAYAPRVEDAIAAASGSWTSVAQIQ